MGLINDLQSLASRHGVVMIGETRAVIAYTVVADLGGGLVRITAAAHGLKKWMDVYIASGSYAGTHRIVNVPSANAIDVEATFVATAAGNLELTAAQYGLGFKVIKAPVTIAEFTQDRAADGNLTVAMLAEDANLVAGQEYLIPFKKIRISAGDIMVVRGPNRVSSHYTNR
jgi:hypothetical protein